jgi:hypothetical protein
VDIVRRGTMLHRKLHQKVAVFAGLLGAVGLVAIPPASAVSDPPQPTISYSGGAIKGDGTTAVVRITYTCSSAVSPLNHLFVAVKQGEGVSPENSRSEDVELTGFLSTNWKVDQGPNALRCDGTTHEQSVVVKPQPGTTGALHTGEVLVQLCLFDNIIDPNAFPPDGGFALDYTMHPAVIAGGTR